MTLKDIANLPHLKLILKVSISVACIFIVFRNISFDEIQAELSHAHGGYLGAAFIFFMLSKFVSAQRLQKYFSSIDIVISDKQNLKLYWLGMFYNLFLPGGIGGDGYKAYYLNKKFEHVKLKTIVVVLLKDRLNGLLMLCIMLLLMILLIEIFLLDVLMVVGILFFITLLLVVEKILKPDTFKNIFVTSFLSFLVQAAQLISVLFILKSLGVSYDYRIMLIVFQISSIASMFPVSIGGVGLREITFLYFSDYFHYNKEASVSVAVLFFLITLVGSLPGIYFHFRKISE